MESQETNNESMPVENSMDVSAGTATVNESTTSTASEMMNEPITAESTTTSDSSMNVENSMAPSNDSTTTVEEVVLKNENNMRSNSEEAAVAKSPAATGRSNKQRKSDENAAEMLQRMRNMWSREFADVPEKSRPKPPSWAARAAMYKTGAEQEEYLQNLIRESRNSLMAKNSSDYNRGLGNNAETLVEQLVTGLDNLSKIARQLKNVTRKGKSVRANNSGMNMGNSNSGMNMKNNYSRNTTMGSNNYGMNNSFSNMPNSNNNVPTRRISPLTNSKRGSQSRMKTSKKPRSAYNEPSLNF